MAKILVVEDEGVVALDIQRRLQSLDYEVTGMVASGEEALEKVTEEPPDLVLMDIMLEGGMDGVEVADMICQRFHIPVVFLTAHSDESSLQRAKMVGPFGYLIKPFKTEELHSTIEIVLYKHQLEEKLIHEWAHARDWLDIGSEFRKDHGPHWGIHYAEVYRLYHGCA